MRPGSKGKPPALKIISGTDDPSRRREYVVDPLLGEVTKPAWLKGRAAKLWAEKIAIYDARGQSVVGCEAALAQYCAIEAALIEQYLKKMTPPVSQITAFRMLAGEFFDTPASQVGPARSPGKGSRFAANVQKPAAAEGDGHA
jgi:hypothetical protein